ncbi:unnamed protein product [Adineta ricciae]|uniref:Uncharacterized protein n=1 Tax=Adineta ricciae TaxID=249248 RepID=A0A816CFK6_ADIRI|nr:unnamed protein product [Adineta ricciae]CAF1620720.1 unnamed protein product [Adineta ricciae]
MLTTSHYPAKSKLSQQYWIDQHSIQIPWLNFLTSQSIPEETDSSDYSRSHRTESESSSSSEESYIILEITQPDKNQQLNYAEIIECKQCVQPLIIEIPKQERAVEHQCEPINEHEKVIQRTNFILFHVPQKLDKAISVSDEDFHIDIRQSTISQYSIGTDTLIEPTKSKTETKIVKHIYEFDDPSKEKYHRVKEQIKTNSNTSKSSTVLRLIKDRTRHVKSKYTLSNKENLSSEPELLNVKYLDGRPSLSHPNYSNKPVSQSNLPTSSSYGKRLINHVQMLLKPSSHSQRTSFRLS